MAETIGALIVELRMDSAKFQAAMDSAQESTRKTGETASQATHQIARMATHGFGEIIPISFRAERALERWIETALKGNGAMALLGKSVLALGAGIAAFKLGQFIGEWLTLGTTVEKYAEAVRKASEEQKAFLAVLTKQSTTMQQLQGQLAVAQGVFGAAEDAAQRARDAQIRQDFGPGARRDEALRLSAQIRAEQQRKLLEDQAKASAEFEQKALEQIQKEQQEQLKAWQTETDFLRDELTKRLKLRQDFEAQLGQGLLPGGEGGAAAGFGAVRTLREQLAREAQQLAFLQREGLMGQTDVTQEQQAIRERALTQAQQLRIQFQQFPAVLDAIDRAVASVEFGNFGLEMEKARVEIERLAPSLGSLSEGVGAFAGQLAVLPAAADPASVAIRNLTADYVNLTLAIYSAINAQQVLVAQ